MADNNFPSKIITYSQFGEMMDKMVTELSNEKFTKIYGPPRGGLPLAVHLSYHLDIPLITSEQILSNMNKWTPEDRLLVVDDIINNGRTISMLSELLKIRKIKHFTAVLFYKPTAIYKPHLFIEETKDWVIFPWQEKQV